MVYVGFRTGSVCRPCKAVLKPVSTLSRPVMNFSMQGLLSNVKPFAKLKAFRGTVVCSAAMAGLSLASGQGTGQASSEAVWEMGAVLECR